MSSFRARLERLERLKRSDPPGPQIRWENFWCAPEDLVPDGIIDWDALRAPPFSKPIDDPMADEILALEQLASEVEAARARGENPDVPALINSRLNKSEPQ